MSRRELSDDRVFVVATVKSPLDSEKLAFYQRAMDLTRQQSESVQPSEIKVENIVALVEAMAAEASKNLESTARLRRTIDQFSSVVDSIDVTGSNEVQATLDSLRGYADVMETSLADVMRLEELASEFNRRIESGGQEALERISRNLAAVFDAVETRHVIESLDALSSTREQLDEVVRQMQEAMRMNGGSTSSHGPEVDTQ